MKCGFDPKLDKIKPKIKLKKIKWDLKRKCQNIETKHSNFYHLTAFVYTSSNMQLYGPADTNSQLHFFQSQVEENKTLKRIFFRFLFWIL